MKRVSPRFVLVLGLCVWVMACGGDFSRRDASRRIAADRFTMDLALHWRTDVVSDGRRTGSWQLVGPDWNRTLLPGTSDQASALLALPVFRSEDDRRSIDLANDFNGGFTSKVRLSVGEVEVTGIVARGSDRVVDLECAWKHEPGLNDFFDAELPDCWGSALYRRYDDGFRYVEWWFQSTADRVFAQRGGPPSVGPSDVVRNDLNNATGEWTKGFGTARYGCIGTGCTAP